MTESPTPSKIAKWRQPLIGGAVSGLIAGIAGIASYYELAPTFAFALPLHAFTMIAYPLLWIGMNDLLVQQQTRN